MKRILPQLIVLTVFTTMLRAQSLSPRWLSFGLSEIKVYGLVLSDATLYASTNAGLYRRSLADGAGEWNQLLGDRKVRTVCALSDDTILAAIGITSPQEPYSGGIFRTTDGGGSWQRFQGGFETWESVPHTPNVIVQAPDRTDLFATGPAVVAKSGDRGAAWSEVWGSYDGLGMGTHFITFAPSDPSTVWSGGEAAILSPYLLKSVDGGDTWTSMAIEAGGDNACYDLAVDYTDPSVAYAGMEGRIIKTADGGASWDSLYGPDTYPYFYGMETTPSDPDLVYAVGARNSPDPEPLTLYASTNGGHDWETYTAPGVSDGSALDLVLVSDGEHDTLYVATVAGVYRCRFDTQTSARGLTERSKATSEGAANAIAHRTGNIVQIATRSGTLGPLGLTVFDHAGRVVATSRSHGNTGETTLFHLDTRLAPGIYSYRFSSEDHVFTGEGLLTLR